MKKKRMLHKKMTFVLTSFLLGELSKLLVFFKLDLSVVLSDFGTFEGKMISFDRSFWYVFEVIGVIMMDCRFYHI